MTTAEIAIRLVALCRDGKIEEAKEELFAPDIMSIEPYEGLLPKETKGMQAIRNKAQLFISHAEHFFGQKNFRTNNCRRFLCSVLEYRFTNER